MRSLLRAALRAALLVAVLALLALVALALQIDRLGRQDHAEPADAIVVLGARVNPDGSPGSDLTSRTLHAVDLWQQGIAPYVICTGGYADEPLSAASVCRRYAVSLGVPAERVLLADGSSNTREDAAVTATIMALEDLDSAVLVSHPLHLYRARWLFRRAGIEATTSPTSTQTHRIVFPLRAWYALREAGGIVLTVIDGWADAANRMGRQIADMAGQRAVD